MLLINSFSSGGQFKLKSTSVPTICMKDIMTMAGAIFLQQHLYHSVRDLKMGKEDNDDRVP